MTGMSGVLKVGLAAQGKEEVEKLMAAVALGLADAVKEGKMTASDACGYFFVPGYLRLEQSPDVDPRLIDALHAGSELEDVERLAPRGMKRALQEIRENALAVLEGLGESNAPLKSKWLR